MVARLFLTSALTSMFAVVLASCASSSANLQTGMTPDQAISAMGNPDLKDSVPDPDHSGGTLLRYTWVDPGKAATFGPDNRLAKVEQVEGASEASRQQQEHGFDPIATPINYFFYPVRAAFIYLGAGVNCALEGQCQKPRLPSPAAAG
jgi:hypothetical protein